MNNRTLLFLLGFPVAWGFISVLLRGELRSWAIRLGAAAIAIVSVYSGYAWLHASPTFSALPHWTSTAALAVEAVLVLLLLAYCRNINKREWWIPAVIVLQSAVVLYLEISGKLPETHQSFYIDGFSVCMSLIVGVIGSLICVHAVGYMKDYHHHHAEMADRRGSFFFIVFLFLSAMFGIAFANNLSWFYIFWEITTLCSFLLIGYSRTEEATRNAYRALGLNAVGGLGMALAILYQSVFAAEPSMDMHAMIETGAAAMIPAVLISFAGLSKSAQMPFSSWLLGAMVAPTPVSALLHSSTMVKAGVFVLLRFAPVLQSSIAGYLIALIGGVSFLVCSMAAVTQSNAKRVLAYSTIANLGLVVMCAGIGTAQAVWAGILIMIFHALAKALLFLTVGTVEHKIASRDIEDMSGLVVSNSFLGIAMQVGILGMFLAPFGMLISKWACLRAFVDADPLLAIILAFGSAPTLFFWAKWLGKILSVRLDAPRITNPGKDESFVLAGLAILTVLVCGLFPWVSRFAIEPFIQTQFGASVGLGQGNTLVMLMMLSVFVLLPMAYLLSPRNGKRVSVYLAGANADDGKSFTGSLGTTQPVVIRNYYLTDMFTEIQVNRWGLSASLVLLAILFAMGAR